MEDEFNDASMEQDVEEIDGEEELTSTRLVNVLSCSKCGERYRKEEYFKKHVESWVAKNS